jgi:transcriptional regulator with XRE-family HTH domain
MRAQAASIKQQLGGQANLRHSAGVPDDSDPLRPEQPTDPRRRALGDAIKAARMTRNCSQSRLADAAEISVRSVAYAEAGERVGRKMLAAIEVALDWPEHKTSDYLNGDDEALKALPARGPHVASAATRQLADIGLTIDILPPPDEVGRLRDLRTKLVDDRLFFQIIDQLTRPHQPTDPRSTEPT